MIITAYSITVDHVITVRSTFQIYFLRTVRIAVQTESCVLQRCVVIDLRYVQLIGEAHDRIPRCLSGLSDTIRIRVIGELQLHTVLEARSSGILGSLIVQLGIIAKDDLLSIDILLVFVHAFRELAVYDLLQVFDLYLERRSFYIFQYVVFAGIDIIGLLSIHDLDLYGIRVKGQCFIHLVMESEVIAVISIHIRYSCIITIRNGLTDLIICDIVPAICTDLFFVVILQDLLRDRRIVGFDLYRSIRISRIHHTQRACGVHPCMIGDLIGDVVSEIQTVETDIAVIHRLRDMDIGPLFLLCTQLCSDLFDEIAEFAVSSFQLLFCRSAFYLVVIQGLDVIHCFIFCHILCRFVQAFPDDLLQDILIGRCPGIVHTFQMRCILYRKQLIQPELLSYERLSFIRFDGDGGTAFLQVYDTARRRDLLSCMDH